MCDTTQITITERLLRIFLGLTLLVYAAVGYVVIVWQGKKEPLLEPLPPFCPSDTDIGKAGQVLVGDPKTGKVQWVDDDGKLAMRFGSITGGDDD